MIAGFEQPDAGEIYLDGRRVAGPDGFVPPERRGVGMVFQEYALFPHLNVAENVAFGLVGKDRRVKALRVAEMLALVGLSGYGERYPHELSGGERQRVALARALAPNPVLVLLDEPFSSLDADRRALVREEVHGILKWAGATAVFVTHDQEEALVMGDRLAVLRQGRLEQVDGPDVVFHNPATRFVAEFMGQTDFLPGRVTPEGIRTEVGLLPQRKWSWQCAAMISPSQWIRGRRKAIQLWLAPLVWLSVAAFRARRTSTGCGCLPAASCTRSSRIPAGWQPGRRCASSRTPAIRWPVSTRDGRWRWN
jgi:ABC-type Fe3+/spermidine/putrescine transport system ATPase subunit